MIENMPHTILLHPYVTEKTLNLMENHNSLMFIVKEGSNKIQIKRAFEKLFEVEVFIQVALLLEVPHPIHGLLHVTSSSQ